MINALNANLALDFTGPNATGYFYDVTNDHLLTPRDALLVIKSSDAANREQQ